MAQYDELTRLLRELLTNRFSPKPRYVRGVLGDGLGNVVVPDRPDKSYARFSKNSTTYFEIFNRTVNPVNNWPILIGELPWQPGLTQVVDTDWSAFEQAGWGDTLGNTSPHAPTHEWPDGSPGSDAVDVHLRAIVPGRAFISDTAPTVIYVNSFEYGTTGTLWAGLPGVDLQPMMSATVTGTMRYAGVYVDESTNSLGIVTGGTTVYTSALEPPRVSFPETGVIPIARVRVYGGQTGLVEADIKDARRLFDTGGGDPNAIPQSLLNAKGDLITATAADTPAILSAGTDGYVLTADSAQATGLKWAESTGGWPYPEVHTVSADGDFATVETALNDAAVGAGDVVELGQDSTEDAVGLDKAVTVQGVSREFALTVDNSANGLNISANGARAERLNVVNTTTAATTYGVYCNATGIVLERVSALVAAGGTTRYGIAVPSSMDATLRDCTGQGTGGGGTNIGLVVDGTATVYGGEFSGDDYSLAIGAAGTVSLYGPRLNGDIFNSGTITDDSWWFDADGNLKFAAGDVYLAGDLGGLFQRSPNHWRTPTDHFNVFSGYTWLNSGSYSGAPSTVDVATYPSLLKLTNSSTGTKHFAYVASAATSFYCRLAKGPNVFSGIRIDDGTENNYIELGLADGTTGTIKLQCRQRAGGGVTTTDLLTGLIPGFYLILMAIGGGNGFGYIVKDSPIPFFAGVIGAAAFTPSRIGIIHEQGAFASINEFMSLVDFIEYA